MASKTSLSPGATRSAASTPLPSPVATHPRDCLDRVVREAAIRSAERKLRHADLNDAIRSALPTLATERAKRAGIRSRPRVSRQPTDAGA
jgi:hypothetical protein